MAINGYTSFDEAVTEVLSFLQGRFGFDLWMLTRVEGDDLLVLHTNDPGGAVLKGQVLRLGDTLCSQMLVGGIPRIAPNVRQEPTLAGIHSVQRLNIGAYAGFPLLKEDGSLFGTVCGLDTESKSSKLVGELPFLQTMGRLLTSLLNAEIKANEQERVLERTRWQALNDDLTGVYNRRAWNQFLQAEEGRARSLGHRLAVLSIDLDDLKITNDTHGHGAGDALLRQAAAALSEVLRGSDVLARVGGDEFAVLALDCDPEGLKGLLERVQDALCGAGVAASVGWALHDPARSLLHTWHQSDQSMYLHKQGRKAPGGAQVVRA